jgi:RIO kinase 1
VPKRTTKTKEIWKTREAVFDEFTFRTLFKLESEGHFINPLSPVSIGKESNVFLSSNKEGKKIILKIYRLQTCDFKQMYKYIRNDLRFSHMRRTRREIIFAWTQREYRNLHIARTAGVSCPTPYAFKNNVLLMECIGEPALKLKDAKIKSFASVAKKINLNLKRLVKRGYTHGDLSAFNILMKKDEPYFIDFSHGCHKSTPGSEDLLKRDISIVKKFFEKKGSGANFIEELSF